MSVDYGGRERGPTTLAADARSRYLDAVGDRRRVAGWQCRRKPAGTDCQTYSEGVERLGLWPKNDVAEPDRNAATEPVRRGGQELPGIAGYQGTARLPKNAMPVTRFNFVRPDGKP